jgi:hypothetical protein
MLFGEGHGPQEHCAAMVCAAVRLQPRSLQPSMPAAAPVVAAHACWEACSHEQLAERALHGSTALRITSPRAGFGAGLSGTDIFLFAAVVLA